MNTIQGYPQRVFAKLAQGKVSYGHLGAKNTCYCCTFCYRRWNHATTNVNLQRKDFLRSCAFPKGLLSKRKRSREWMKD